MIQNRKPCRIGFVWALPVMLFVTILVLPSVSVAENWSRFRGENGTGISEEKGFPTQWSAKDYAWKIDLPGKGHSSPVIWGNQAFITSGDKTGNHRILACYDVTNGKELWKQTITLSPVHLHKKNSFASGSPTTDGNRVYVAFADDGHYILAAYTMDGKPVWNRDFGEFSSQHGPGASPMVYKDCVILTKDMLGPSELIAVDSKTGKDKFRVPRPEFRRSAYGTPIVVDVAGSPQIICVSGANGVTGHDPQTGKQLWGSGQMLMRTVASPVYGDGVVIAMAGSGGSGKQLLAVELPKEQASEPTVRFNRKKELPYVPTPVYYQGHLFLWSDSGVVSCLKMSTGDVVWMKRVGGKFSGSPICVDGRLYCISEDGNVVVVAASPEYEHLGSSPLGEYSHSTPAVAGGRMLLRTENQLFCIESTELQKPKS